MELGVPPNPFPGLRPFEPDEDHLFFGREKQIDELLRRLRGTHFVAVVGASGSGKSSLVRCGLIPALEGGSMAQAGSGWRVAILRPGEDPIGHLAAALSVPECLGAGEELAGMGRALVEATLRRSTLGLAEAVREARLPAHENIMVLVDQFEELFRFRRNQAGAGDEAAMFVKLLLEAAGQENSRIYIVLTMRSDFIGDCVQYPNLPEAVNDGLYLVPRMSRDELRSAIAGPVAVGAGQIAPRLVVRLLNEVGDNADQLPILQHALMRTWDYWQRHGPAGEPIDIAHYEAIGTIERALSQHAEEAFADAASEAQRRIVERSFKALTDTFTDPRGVRRPTSVAELAAVCEAPEPDVIAVLEAFRRPGRSFLMPPAKVPLNSRSVVDLSHESLMRLWDRLVDWTEQERISAERYFRLSRAAAWHAEGSAGLWRDPELELGLQWRQENRPTAAWAARYDPAFGQAMAFLDESWRQRAVLLAERELERRRTLRRARLAAGILAGLLVIAVFSFLLAARERDRAEKNLHTANDVVDNLLLASGAGMGSDAPQIPEIEAFRRTLLDQARVYLHGFAEQQKSNPQFRKEIAESHLRLGNIDRLQGQNREAAEEFQTAIRLFEDLRRHDPADPNYREKLGDAWNWYGEAERALGNNSEAEKAYVEAVNVQQELLRSDPTKVLYLQHLARSRYNLGILHAPSRGPDSEAEYREAIRLLDPLTDPQSRSGLAHAYNDLAMLFDSYRDQKEQARRYYEQAIGIEKAMLASHPENRDYRFDLAKFYNNEAMLLESLQEDQLSLSYSEKAVRLFEDLARPTITFTIELAQAHTLRGRTLQYTGPRAEAEKEYQTAIEMFAHLVSSDTAQQNRELHLRYGEALLGLGTLLLQENPQRARELFSQAAAQLALPGSEINLCRDFFWLAKANLVLGAADQAQQALDRLTATLPKLPQKERAQLGGAAQQLQKQLGDPASAKHQK